MQIAELATKFSFQGSMKPLDNLNAGLTSAIGSIAKVTTVFTAAGVALNGFLASTLASADAQVQLSRETQIGIEEMQKWGYVASVNGGSADAMQASLVGLSRRIGEAANGAGEGVEVFQRLGISIRDGEGKIKSADLVMRDLQSSLGNLSQAEKISVLDKLGIDQKMLQTLQLSSTEMDKLMSKAEALGVISQDDADKVAAFNDSLTTLKFGVDNIQKRLAIAFAPSLQEVADGFTDLLVSNKDMIQNGLKKFFELVNTGLGAIFRFGKLLYNLIDGTVGFENALIIAGAAMLYLNRAMYMNPIGLIIAGIAALIVIFDDLMTGLEGGQSVIADWFKEWFNIDIIALIKDIGVAFDSMSEMLSSAFSSTIEGIKSGFSSMVQFVKNIIDSIIEFFKPVAEIFDRVANFKMPSLSDVGESVTSSVGDFFSGLNPFGDSPKEIASKTVPTATTNASTQNNSINIEIKSDNPQLAGQQVSNELQSILKNANTQFNKGGR